jgi:hypothetical protein
MHGSPLGDYSVFSFSFKYEDVFSLSSVVNAFFRTNIRYLILYSLIFDLSVFRLIPSTFEVFN